MTTREKIILAATGLTLIFGVYQLFLTGPDTGTAPKKNETSAELTQFIQQVSAQIKQTSLSVTEKYVIAHSSLPWGDSPFLESFSALSAKGAKRITAPQDQWRQVQWKYSGYVSLGNKKLAIINGVEYEAGEMLKEKDYYLRKIESDYIEIVRIKDGKAIIAPLKDNQNLN